MARKHRPATPDRPLFSFVVVADTHVNEHDDVCTSPFQTNHLANERARHVFADIARMEPRPKFVIHLGDIVHPVPALPSFHEAVAQFKDMTRALPVPLHVVPGNHDVGDKRVEWMPADQVCDRYLEIYRESFGKDYFSVDEGDIRCILINSLLINSGLEGEAQQKAWLEKEISEAGSKRVFLFMHYPPFIYQQTERSSYDNLDEPGRSWLISQMQRPEVEATFAGHVHNFWYDKVGKSDFYMLPSTAFLRHDFSEFYRVRPPEEFGRGDVAKFGYFVVDVFPDRHVAYSIRTMGARLAQGDDPCDSGTQYLAHPQTSRLDRVGFELRHAWTEVMQIPSTGGVQEFGRKWARNDYPLMALWEMGAKLSKVTDLDLLEEQSRERMNIQAQMGHRYLITVLGSPKKAVTTLDLTQAGVLGFEVNTTTRNFAALRPQLNIVRKETGKEIFFCKIHTYDDSHYDGKHFSHFVKSGFQTDELDACKPLVQDALTAGDIDGITVRVDATESIAQVAPKLIDFANSLQCSVVASIKLSSPGIATERSDDRDNVLKVAHAVFFSTLSPRIRYVFDTFMDVDRGYYPRQAFIDRQFNPRPAARAFATLNSIMSGGTHFELAGSAGAPNGLELRVDDNRYVLGQDDSRSIQKWLAGLPAQTMMIDLVTNQESTVQDWLALAASNTAEQNDLLEVIFLRPSPVTETH
jgi:predicted phosphodiesterase